MEPGSKNKRILVVTSRLPFVYGGNTVLACSIVCSLKKMGYSSDTWFTPQNRFGRQLTGYLATRFTDVGFTGKDEPVDQVITMRFPSYAVKHPFHVCWLNHCMREYYDLWTEHEQQLPSIIAIAKEKTRKWIFHHADKTLLTKNVTRLFAQSKNIADRLKTYLGIDCQVLYPPPRTDLTYNNGSTGNYVLSVSRLNKQKRVDIFVKSFSFTGKCGVKGIIVGEGEEYQQLKKLIETEDLEDNVSLKGDVSVQELSNLYSNALAIYYAPVDEDYGNITLESFRFKKPVITAIDSGGPLELVKHEENGYIVEPDPKHVAEIMVKLFENKKLTRELGTQGHQATSHITWENTIPKLVICP